jgi:hypothetical protein
MSQQSKLLGKALFLSATFLGCTLRGAPVTVQAPVVEMHGTVTRLGGGATGFGKLQVGESLAEGSAIQTGADSRVFFAPVPGVAVTEAKNTSVSLIRLAVTKNRDGVQQREAVLRLAPGTLSFSLEKQDSNTTSFTAETPSGTMTARGSVGTVTVVPPCVKIASLSGKVAFTLSVGSVPQASRAPESAESSAFLSTNSSPTASGGTITIPPGSFLTVCGKGDDVVIGLINTIEKTWTLFSVDGTLLSTRGATAQELESTRAFFEAALAHGSLAVGYGLLSAEVITEVTQTLTAINQSFAAAGLKPIETSAVGSSSRQSRSSSSESTPPSGGFSGGPLNPANTSGEVISREQ